MRANIVLGLCCLLAIAIVATTSSAKSHQGVPKSNQVDIDYAFPKSGITLHEPVVAMFSVHNGLSRPITLTLGAQSIQFFEFSLTTPDGQVLKRSFPLGWDPAEVVIFNGEGEAVVAPGAVYEHPLLLNRWFSFETPGTYSLTSQLTTNIEVSGGQSIPPQSRTIRLDIKPRDPVRLKKVCEELARQVDLAPNAEAAQNPALRLGYIDDPVAVPYLAEVLEENKLIDHLVIPGLERIGTSEAVEVLLSGLHSELGDRADLSRQALTRMQERISDPNLRETVKRVLTPTPSD